MLTAFITGLGFGLLVAAQIGPIWAATRAPNPSPVMNAADIAEMYFPGLAPGDGVATMLRPRKGGGPTC